MGCDSNLLCIHCRLLGFQSTQPEWAATYVGSGISYHRKVISIHAARVGCDCPTCNRILKVSISIHAARVGCDPSFLKIYDIILLISIHAARVGCDCLPVAAVQ